jgi:hypothetical protein
MKNFKDLKIATNIREKSTKELSGSFGTNNGAQNNFTSHANSLLKFEQIAQEIGSSSQN